MGSVKRMNENGTGVLSPPVKMTSSNNATFTTPTKTTTTSATSTTSTTITSITTTTSTTAAAAYTPPLNLKRSRKISAKKPASVRKPERQLFGLIVALLSLCAAVALLIRSIHLAVIFREYHELVIQLLWILSCGLTILFYFSAITKPEYLGGDPNNDKMLPVVAAAILRIIAHFIHCSINGPFSDFFLYTLAEMALVLSYKKVYFLKDDSGSVCLCFKPWIIRSIPISEAINYNQKPPRYPVEILVEP